MDCRYKIILSSQNVYREIELSPDARELKVGTGIECDVRLHRDLFFGSILLTFRKDQEREWSVSCLDGLYLTAGDVRKLMTAPLRHGDVLAVKYADSGNTVFQIEFLIDFDSGRQRYERIIDIAGAGNVTLGGAPGSNILLKSSFTRGDRINLRQTREGLVLEISAAQYGVYHNGRKAVSGEIIRDMDFFSLSDFFFYYKDGRLYTEIRPETVVTGLPCRDQPSNPDYPRFNRSTRIREKLCDDSIEILNPPEKPQKPKNNLLTRLLPSMGMLLVAAIMVARGGTGMYAISAISGVMALVTSVIAYRDAKKDYKEGTADRIAKYTAYIDKKRQEISQLRAEERDALDRKYISARQELRELSDFSSSLFDRYPGDDDFLDVRLGEGDVEALRKINFKKQERLEVEDDLQRMPGELDEEFVNVHDAPVVCPFREAGAVGIVGPEDCRYALLKNILIDITARQYNTDVKMAFICGGEHEKKLRWLRMLPNVCDDAAGLRLIVSDEESRNAIFEYLYRQLSARERAEQKGEHIVVFVYDECGFQSHPLSKFVFDAAKLGVTFVFFGDTAADIPLGCRYVVELPEVGKGRLIDATGEKLPQPFGFIPVGDADAQRVVELLSSVYTEEVSLEGSLTKSISLFQLLNIITVDDIDLAGRWSKTQVFKSMSAPIGVSKAGVVSLDLHDKAHGPHGLVAGTTGSGKSEVLQTYILSMATLFSPSEVAFVIIDFKGGGMVDQFRNLPHLTGAITNIDGKEINRSLKSINAELRKRQRLFKEADVNHIDKYIKKYLAGEISTPLPHLIVIVDEFAELKAQQPDFMKELISAARIGRSLGVHLILATQKPSGQVNEQIWSNSRFKLCLKVQSPEDSNEMLKSPLAAEIKEPGRAYLQVGNNEIFELFQSAYSGASEKTYDNAVKEFTISSVSDSGRRTTIFSQKNKAPGEETRTQLQAIVSYIADYCDANHVERLPAMFLPSLDHVINYPQEVSAVPAGSVTSVDLGMYDDPDNQFQGVYSVDVGTSNLMIIGSSRSGKTNLLQVMIREIAEKYTPQEVNIYIIDFGSMVLKNFEGLRHVGGVVTSAEDEKLRNLFKLLFREIERRKKRMLEVGVGSFDSYREAGLTDLPQIVLMIDNLTALKEMYFQDDDEILRLCREGLSVGISVVVANSQTAGIGYKYLSNFSERIALFCNDTSEYSALFDHCRERVDNIPGRCLVEVDKTFMDGQIYLAFQGEKEIDRIEEIRAFVSRVNSRQTERAVSIPEVPEQLTADQVVASFAPLMRKNFALVAGLDYSTVNPYVLTLSSQGALAVSGRPGASDAFLRYAVDMLWRMYPERVAVYVVDGIAKGLSDLRDAPGVREYTFLSAKAAEFIAAIDQQLAARYKALESGDETVLAQGELLVLILNSPEAAEAISQNNTALDAYRRLTGRYRNLNAVVLVGNYENAPVPYGAPEVIKKLKDARQFLFFDDLANLKILDVPMSTLRENKKPAAPGDGFVIRDNSFRRIKTPAVPETQNI